MRFMFQRRMAPAPMQVDAVQMSRNANRVLANAGRAIVRNRWAGSAVGLWLVGLLVVFVLPAPYPITHEMLNRYEQKAYDVHAVQDRISDKTSQMYIRESHYRDAQVRLACFTIVGRRKLPCQCDGGRSTMPYMFLRRVCAIAPATPLHTAHAPLRGAHALALASASSHAAIARLQLRLARRAGSRGSRLPSRRRAWRRSRARTTRSVQRSTHSRRSIYTRSAKQIESLGSSRRTASRRPRRGSGARPRLRVASCATPCLDQG
jgi:hypothetical protein